jgi:predicted dehydrogenase
MTTTTNNDRSSPARLRVGLIAEGERLALVAPAVQACPLVQLCGQSGMPQTAALPDIPWFDDRRQLIGHPDVQAVLLATTTRGDLGLGAMALERGLPVWRLPPIARSFAEAAELAAAVARQTTVYRVASWWEHVENHAWRELQWPDDFQPILSELRVAVRGPDPQSWRCNLAEAGGGVLTHDAYGWLEALVAVRGLPETLCATVARQRVAPGAAPRETEDAALATLRYAGDGSAALRAAWDAPPFEQTLTHHGHSATVTLNADEVTLLDAAGTLRDRHPLPTDFLAGELHRFAEWVGGDAHARAAAALERHLAVSALLETIYLSARTNHPESPRKLYEAQGWPLPRS